MASKEGGAGEKKPAADQGSDAKLEQAMKDSPYLQYDNLEDYKRQGYGTEGHQQVQPGRGAGSTEGPTESGASAASKEDVSATETINRQGVN
ncbi:uncharacterized protein LOC126795958 [Argentina anserina]|uniref:uncharacterized protein LOC126795958 n=1 Tax=Argentina anserina TaxID=57926 RepID=UPI0021762E97|nr:uncharacterized protein LOC126795958 [Potentilla anserina]